jgi:hypothetical protein
MINGVLFSAACMAGAAFAIEAEAEADQYRAPACPDFYNWEHFDTPEYNAMSAYCKQEAIWSNVIKDTTPEKFFIADEFQPFFEQNMNLTFDAVTDTMPVGRIKRTHPRGTTTKIEFIAAHDTPYTGMFKGAKHGIMRISEFSQTEPSMPKTAPGHGVKLLRDGMTSGNWFAMFAFEGQDSFNFFKNRWTNILREMDNECARHTIGKHMNEVTDHIGAMSLMELAQFDQYGNEVYDFNWPFQIDVEPYDVYGWTDEYQNDFQDQLSIIPENTAMFKVFGYDSPPELGGKERMIGWIVSRSETTSSLWGD